MPNLRVVYENKANTAASITASSTAGTLAASNMLTDFKTEVWRSTATTATLTLTWAANTQVSMVALPFCNLTSQATFKVECFNSAGATTPTYTSPVTIACPSSIDDIAAGQLPLGVNAYSYGGGTYGVIWIPVQTVQKIVLTISDPTNPMGYLEAGKIVAGAYWEPTVNCQYGVVATPYDMTKSERTDSGNQFRDRGAMYKGLSLDLSYMPVADRNVLWRIVRGNGSYTPVFLSLTPESSDTFGSQIYQVYGTMPKLSGLTYSFYNQFNTKLEIEEI